MKQFTNAEFSALTTEQREELRKEFCVYNDGSQRFKDTVVRFFIEKDEYSYDGSAEECYYNFPSFPTRTITRYPHNPIITIDQFCELFPDYSDIKKPQLSSEDIEAIAKSVVTMIASGNTIKGSDGVEYQVTVVEPPKNVTDAPPTPEPSYKLEDIVEIVKPAYYLYRDGSSIKTVGCSEYMNHFPKESQGKQEAALCQLFKLMEWANEGRERKEGEYFYKPYYTPSLNKVNLTYGATINSPIYFFDINKAHKLIEANEQLFKDFFGV